MEAQQPACESPQVHTTAEMVERWVCKRWCTSTNSGARRASLLIFPSLLPLIVLYISYCIRYLYLPTYRYRHTRLKLVFMLSRGHLSSTTRHIECSRSNVRVGMQLAACANGVRMGCLAGCPRSCGAVRARRSSAASWSSIIVLAHTGNLTRLEDYGRRGKPARKWGKVDYTCQGRGLSLSLEGATTWWRPGLPASGADQGLRLTECACWRSRARTGVAAMLMGWGEKSNHRKSALDGLRVDVSLAVSPWQARAEVPPTSPVFSGQSPFLHGTKTAPTDRRLCRE